MALQEQIRIAWETGQPLMICGGNSKNFLGQPNQTHQIISTNSLNGVIDYQPAELVIRAQAGTPLLQIEQLLAQHGQILPFEPPHFSVHATLGGSIASALSGPSRPWRGAARDFVLGCTLINGKGERLHFGGEVIKNVAGYDVSRLQCGAFGSLGLLLDLSIKTVPAPELQVTLIQEADEAEALHKFTQWNQQPLPLSGLVWQQGKLRIRLSGAYSTVAQAQNQIGGDLLESDNFWQQLKEQRLDFFDQEKPLWRLSLPLGQPQLQLPGDYLIDWGGAQRWLISDAAASQIQQLASEAGGHACSYRNGPFQPLAPGMLALHQRLKRAFDPKGILNPGRLYPDL